MSNTTIKRPTLQDSDLHDDTVIYRACKPRVRVIEINAFEEIGAILNFRPSGLRVAREIIRRQHGENITIACTDAEMAEALWFDLPDAARLTKLVRAKRYLMEDQSNSNFRYIWKVARQVEQKQDGSYYGLPSKYRPGDYWGVSDELQFRSNEQGREFLSMSPYKCRQMEREVLSEILAERGCVKIVRLRKKKEEKEVKEKAPALLCNCDCASCVSCSTKNSATASEANGAEPAPVGSRELITREVVNREIETALEMLFQAGARWANLGLDTKEYWKKILDGYGINELRLADAIKRNNAPSVRLVGGQPK